MKYYDTSFDSQFDTIENLTWKPWVGKNYSNAEHKVLIIGESHYEWPTESDGVPSTHYLADDNFSRNSINSRCLKHLSGSKLNEPKLFTNAILSINNGISDELREKTWFNAAFYNFIQRPMKDHKNRPSREDFQNGWEVFENILDVVEPSYCIFLGLDTANSFNVNYLKNWKTKGIVGFGNKAYKVGRPYGRTVSFEKGNQKIDGVFIKHPSSFFSWDKWHQFMKTHIPNYINSLS